MSTTGQVRIGDAERDRAVTTLGEHFAAGRITKEEFDERSDTATRARYAGEIAPLFTDLPDAGAAVQPLPSRQLRRPAGPPPPFLFLVPVVVVVAVVTAIVAAPWLLWMLFALAMFMGPWGGRRHHHWHSRHPRGHQYQR